nr:MAG TPA: Membrane MotB of proton-channel complex MotA/MotB [Caudoviricetes sp.]DAH61170.1 MAG TPA: Membrane MotB of proton-channel complex MotA/MotB [Caudoviricetes sp.]
MKTNSAIKIHRRNSLYSDIFSLFLTCAILLFSVVCTFVQFTFKSREQISK